MDAYCSALKHINCEFINYQTNKQKISLVTLEGCQGTNYRFEKGSISICPAYLYKLYYMLTQVVDKGKFLFVEDFKVNK